MANRHLLRTIALQILFEWDFNNQNVDIESVQSRMVEEFAAGAKDEQFAGELVNGVLGNLAEIDQMIVETAPEWPLAQIPIIDRNVLRLGIFELVKAKQVPPKVAINEAVEMGKRFGGDSSGKFVNGVLGTLYKKIYPEGDINLGSAQNDSLNKIQNSDDLVSEEQSPLSVEKEANDGLNGSTEPQ